MKTYQGCINNDVRACRFSFWNQRKRVKRRILTPKPGGINEAMAFSVCLLLLAAIISGATAQLQATVISEPDDVSVCEGGSTTLTCVLGATGATVEWYRFINTGAIQRIRQNGQDITLTTSNVNTTTSSSLTINNAKESHTGYYWVGEETEGVCNASVTVSTKLSALTVNITKNTKNSLIVVQWDEVDDSLTTTYIVTWTERDHIGHHVTLTEQSSYTITGLTLDTVYTITVVAANRCGQGPEYRTSVSLSTETTSTISSISTTVSTSASLIVTIPTATANPSIDGVTFAITNPESATYSKVFDTSSLFITSTVNPSTMINTDVPISTTPTTFVTFVTNPGVTTTSSISNTMNTMMTSDATTTTTSSFRLTTTVIKPSTTTTTMTSSLEFTTSAANPTATAATTTTGGGATTTATSTVPTATTTTARDSVSPSPTSGVSDTADDSGFNLEDYRYIAAGALGALIVFIVIIMICCCCCCCRRRKRDKAEADSLKLKQYTTLSSDGSPSKEVPSATNTMTIMDEKSGEPMRQDADQMSITETDLANGDFDLNSQPLNPPDTYDKLIPRQPPVHPTDTYDRLPSSSTFNQLPSASMYDKLPPSRTIHNFPSGNTYDRLPSASSSSADNSLSNNTYDKLPPTPSNDVEKPLLNNTYDKLPATPPKDADKPSTPPNTYDKLPSSTTFDKLPSANTYDKLPTSKTFHNFPLPSIPQNTYDKVPTSNSFHKLPSTNTCDERLPAVDANKLHQTKIEEMAESHDGSHYYDELPCNMKKDAHTGENAYDANEDASVKYAVLQPLPTPKHKLIFSEDPSKLYAQIA